VIAHDAAKYYLEQSNKYSVIELRQKFKGELLIRGGKPYIVFSDDSTLSVQKVVQAKFHPEEVKESIDEKQA